MSIFNQPLFNRLKQSFKSFIRHNRFYKHCILPIRLKLNELIESKLDDEAYFAYRYKKIFGYIPDFRNPQSFNEKIIHRILYDRNPIYTALADKLKARIYIASMLQHISYNPQNMICNDKYNGGGYRESKS